MMIAATAVRAQEVISVLPNTGKQEHRVDVQINAKETKFNLYDDIVISLEHIGGSTIQSFGNAVQNDSTLSCSFYIPSGVTVGVYALRISSLNQTSVLLDSAFTVTKYYGGGYIKRVTPPFAYLGHPLTVRVHGSSTRFLEADTVVVYLAMGNVFLYSISTVIESDTTLSATFDFPADLMANQILFVVKRDDVKLTDEYFYFTKDTDTSPHIISCVPADAQIGETVDLTITGAFTQFTKTEDIIAFVGDNSAYYTLSSFVVESDTVVRGRLHIPYSARQGFNMVGVGNKNVGAFSKSAYFLIHGDDKEKSRLLSITPVKVTPGKIVDFVINAYNTSFTDATKFEVYCSDRAGKRIYATSAVSLSVNSLKASIPLPQGIETGNYSVTVKFDNSQLFMDGFWIVDDHNPTNYLLSIDPSVMSLGDLVDATVLAKNTHFLSSTNISGALFADGVMFSPDWIIPENDTTLSVRFYLSDSRLKGGLFTFGLYTKQEGYSEVSGKIRINPVGLNESAQPDNLKIYPNPVTAKLVIDAADKDVIVIITSISGKEIPVDDKQMEQENGRIIIDTNKMNLENGVYFIRIESVKYVKYQKLIVKRE